uniref:Metalloserrulase 15 n=1 Tax=Tityus serrulatus TaxID=6887 RepID=A0A1S5QN58_TITSE|nr:metalloserrulase 15 [Tityus serrulatus]
MICLVNILLFASVSTISNGRVDVVFPSVETSKSGMKTVKFRAFNQDVELKMKPAGEILAKNFAFFDENGQVPHPIDVENLNRKLFKNSEQRAALIIDEDGPLTIEGILNRKVRITPFESRKIIKNGIIAHRVLEEISEEKSYLHNNVTFTNIEREAENMKRMARVDQSVVIEYFCVAESNFTEHFKKDEHIIEYLTRMYIGVQDLLETLDLGIKVRLLGVQAFKKGNDPFYIEESAIPGYENYLDHKKLIIKMADYFCKHATGLAKDADIIMLTTERKLGELVGSTINKNIRGASNASSVCNQCSKVGVAIFNKDRYSNVQAIARETASLIGIPRDGEDGKSTGLPESPGALNCPFKDGYLMGDLSDRVHKYRFSECSKSCLRHLLSLPRANCLFEVCKNCLQ